MPHFPEWFVLICILLPIGNQIYKKWKNRKKQLFVAKPAESVNDKMKAAF